MPSLDFEKRDAGFEGEKDTFPKSKIVARIATNVLGVISGMFLGRFIFHSTDVGPPFLNLGIGVIGLAGMLVLRRWARS